MLDFSLADKVGENYYELLKRIHLFLKPTTYVEIGIQQGKSFALARATNYAVGIDPEPRLPYRLWHGAKVFPLTSDKFFARHDLRQELGGNPVDLAFIDGLHLFEFALRDFINLERHAHQSSVILVHDCYPVDAATASRVRTTRFWTGDVWKLIVCLKKYRPDLAVFTIDIPPSGLGIICKVDPTSKVLQSSLETIYREFVPLDFGWIVPDKASSLNRLENNWHMVRSVFSEHNQNEIK